MLARFLPPSTMISHLQISRARLAFILGGLAMFGPFSIDTVFPAFPAMARDLGVGKLAMQQTISVYLIGYAAMSLFHGPISDAIGRKKVLLARIVVFTLAAALPRCRPSSACCPTPSSPACCRRWSAAAACIWR